MNLCCCIPGCEEKKRLESKKTRTMYKYAYFNAPDPRFVRNKERADWANKLKGIILRFRDPAKDNILGMFHRELVKICERHFTDDDMVYKQGSSGQLRKMLKPGALPTLEFPTKSGLLLPNPYARHVPRRERPGLVPSTRSPTVVKEKTFSCLVENAQSLKIKKMWDVQIGEKSVTFSKPSKAHDQSELIVAINTDFKIWISYYGWSLPPGHRLTEISLMQKSLLDYLDEVDSKSPCDGFTMPEGIELSELKNVHEHVVTKSSEPFTHGVVQKRILAYRSTNCEVLLSENGVCNVCSDREALAKKIHARKIREVDLPFANTPPDKSSDSYLVKRLKMTLRKRTATLKRVQNKLEKRQRTLDGVQMDDDLYLAEKSEKEKFKNDMIDVFLNYRKSVGASPMFDAFWKIQLEVITQQARPGCALRFDNDFIGFLCDIFQNESTVYEKFRNSKLLVLPSLKAMRRCREKRQRHMNEVIMEVSHPAPVTDDSVALAPLPDPSTFTSAISIAMSLNSVTPSFSTTQNETEAMETCKEHHAGNSEHSSSPKRLSDDLRLVHPEAASIGKQRDEGIKTTRVNKKVSKRPRPIVIEVVKGQMWCRDKSSPKRQKNSKNAPARPFTITRKTFDSSKTARNAAVKRASARRYPYKPLQTKRVTDGSLIVSLNKMSKTAVATRRENQKRNHSDAFLFPLCKTSQLLSKLENSKQQMSSDDTSAPTIPEIT